MKIVTTGIVLLAPWLLSGASRGEVEGGVERRLYVTDRSGISVYDINDSHKLLRKIDVPENGDYKGVSASPQLGKLYITNPSETPHPGWLSFIDGEYAYPDGEAVIDTAAKKVVARIPTSEKLVEFDFRNGKPVKAGHR